jgi:hypothetical protein
MEVCIFWLHAYTLQRGISNPYPSILGGWVLGNLNSEAAWCRHMCNKAHIKVIDVDYRLAPEFPYPTSIYDSWDAVKWVSTRFNVIWISFVNT